MSRRQKHILREERSVCAVGGGRKQGEQRGSSEEEEEEILLLFLNPRFSLLVTLQAKDCEKSLEKKMSGSAQKIANA